MEVKVTRYAEHLRPGAVEIYQHARRRRFVRVCAHVRCGEDTRGEKDPGPVGEGPEGRVWSLFFFWE